MMSLYSIDNFQIKNLLSELRLIPNLISLSRVVLGFLFMYVAICSKAGAWYLLILLLLIGLSDVLDGYLSRRWKMQSRLGCILDPICDKIVIVQTGIVFVFYLGVPLWLFVFLMFKDLLFVVAGVYLSIRNGHIIEANLWGKLTTALLTMLGLIVLFNWAYFYPELNSGLITLVNTLIVGIVVSSIVSIVSYFRVWKIQLNHG